MNGEKCNEGGMASVECTTANQNIKVWYKAEGFHVDSPIINIGSCDKKPTH